ncbi:hypothetical protein [Pseudomonas huaxiensis]|uniref:hypothetical protein n=1 Tax=Pseudomonas huaxiensis TaxID=2213017 RepID=UPI000DA6AB5D|nr:hypothetical protein [Pseudomonas huaxiensis]
MTAHQQAARQCAGLFRLGRDVEAAVEMVSLFEAVMPEFERAPHALQAQSATLLAQILAAQQRQDWLCVADNLEYELLELIERTAST